MVAFLRRCLAGATVEDLSAAAGLSMACTERCLDVLRASDVVRCEGTRVLWGFGSVPAYLWSLSLTEGCLDLLAHLPWQDPPPASPPERVPPQFWWLFSSGTHPAELRLPQDAVTVAGRMFDGADPPARAWALTNLPVDALRECERCAVTTPDPMRSASTSPSRTAPMPEIDRWSECLSEEMRAVWPTLAAPATSTGWL